MNDINRSSTTIASSYLLSFNNFHCLQIGDLIDSPDPRYIDLFHPDRALSKLWNTKILYFPNNWSFEGLAVRDFLVPSRSSDSLWRAGCLQADEGCQLDGVSSDTLLQLASGLTKQCGLAGLCFGGCMALDLRLSRVCRGVANNCNYQLGRKIVKKYKYNF
jgi:hypothetical protein